MSGLTAAQMVAFPWAWQGPGRTPQRDAHGNEWFEIRIVELPDFYVAAPTADQVIAEAGPALEAFLDSYLQEGEQPPLPASVEITNVEPYRKGFTLGLQAA